MGTSQDTDTDATDGTYDVRLQYIGAGRSELFTGIAKIGVVVDKDSMAGGVAILYGPRQSGENGGPVGDPVVALIPLADTRYLARVDYLAPEDRD